MRFLILSLGLLLAVALFLGVAAWRWGSGTAELISRLRTGPRPEPARYVAADVESLPAPVARYFRAVLRDGQPLVRRGRVVHEGEFLMRPPDGWRPFRSTEHFATAPPGFVWDARIRMLPGFSALVRDGFIGGRGSMRASAMGVFSLVAVEGTPDMASGALHRYLAEASWLPTALLPACGVAWSSIDDKSARATLSVAGTSVSADFHFDESGLARRVYAAARARDVGGRGVPTPWQARLSGYEERAGMRIPLHGEVEWLLPEGPLVYWRGRVVDVVYESD